MWAEENNDEYVEEDDFQGDIIEGLLEEIKQQRIELKGMIEDLEKIKKHIDDLFPESLDKRFIRFFEEKVKAATGLFNSILDMRKEITKSLKDEIEIRRKLKSNEDDGDDGIDIEKIASKVEKLNLVKNKLNQKLKRKKGDNDE